MKRKYVLCACCFYFLLVIVILNNTNTPQNCRRLSRERKKEKRKTAKNSPSNLNHHRKQYITWLRLGLLRHDWTGVEYEKFGCRLSDLAQNNQSHDWNELQIGGAFSDFTPDTHFDTLNVDRRWRVGTAIKEKHQQPKIATTEKSRSDRNETIRCECAAGVN